MQKVSNSTNCANAPIKFSPYISISLYAPKKEDTNPSPRLNTYFCRRRLFFLGVLYFAFRLLLPPFWPPPFR